ncbi:AAA family ATPase [Terribacillus sp. 179-K 1B1 HS]|uniref:deoxynucleotide monophosphate kinase family protein n=1 Tax=Terribacillus sp. 179-K 1B1 HS TaxID=3142388 RepID=UPI0039A023DF
MTEPNGITRIALTGKLRSGKSTVERHLTQQHGFNSVAFGDQLKYFAHKIFDDATDDAAYDPFRPGSPQKPRALYQQFGQLCREIDPDVWIKHAQRTVEYYERLRDTTGIVISDLRQPNEYEWAKANGFTIVKVVADDAVRLERARQAGDKMTEEDFVHDTESYVDGFAADYTVVNDGELAELQRKVDGIIEDISKGDD